MVELLVSITVLTLLIVLVSQITSQANKAISGAGRQMDTASDAGVALDRLGANLSGLTVAQGIAPVVYKNTPDSPSGKSGAFNDGIAFMCNSRTRERSVVQTSPNNFIRMAMVGYRVQSFPDDLLGGTNVPKLSWGDGTISYSKSDGTGNIQPVGNAASSNLQNAMLAVAGDLGDGGSSMIQPEALGQGIFRFELCFLLDDGTVVEKPPRDLNFPAASYPVLTGNSYAVAVTRETSADVNKRYAKAIIVGMAALDAKTRQLVGTNGADVYKLADDLPDPSATNQTPLQAWDFTSNTPAANSLRTKLSAPNYPPPILQNLRIYQRYYYISGTP